MKSSPEAPLASIVVRSMGRSCLANAIASVAYQTHRPLELVVVDATGGSHPPLPELPTLTRARLVSVGRRLNRPAAANVGLEHAEGEWIGFLDDDDIFEPTHVARLLARAAEPDRPRLVYGQLWGLDRFHRVVQRRHQGFNPLIMLYNCQISAMSCLMHRSLRDEGLRLDETLETSEDWDFWLRLMAHTTFGTVREATHFYFAEAGTSGTGIGLNSRNRGDHFNNHGIVRRRFERQREQAWADHFARLSKGIAMQRAGDIDAALAFYEQMRRDYPDEPNILYLKAQAHLQAGQLQTARVTFRQAIYLNGDAADYYLGLGDTCARLGDDDEARSAYADAVRFKPELRATVTERVARLAPVSENSAQWSSPGSTTVGRNEPCPCGSGLRYKLCHGKVAAAVGSVAPTADSDLGHVRAHGMALAAAGCNRRARTCLQRVLEQTPNDAEALHAHALLAWDVSDLATAEIEIARAAALAPGDPQIAENHIQICNARFERDNARKITALLATLVGTASGRSGPEPLAPGTAVQIISPFENAYAGTERHALELARLLEPHAPVQLWSTERRVPAALAALGVIAIETERGSYPKDGVLAFLGSWQPPPSWVIEARPSRILVVHNVSDVAALLNLVQGLLAQTTLPVELLMPSETFRVLSGLPGTSYPTPIDIELFAPRGNDESERTPFTVGRLSRNDHLKYHPDDPELLRRLTDAGMRVRVMGGTVLRRYFPPADPTPGLELLPPASENAESFLRTLDAFLFRTSPLWIEAAGRVIAEAMATGLPCVCARNVGFAELIEHGVDGYLFDADDDDAAFAHLCALRDDPRLRRRIGAAARAKTVQTFGSELAEHIRHTFLGR